MAPLAFGSGARRPTHEPAPAGRGQPKCGGNYASALIAQNEAQGHGCQQVLFTDAATHQYIEEAGAMNIFLVIDDTLITPPTEGTILDGVTRDSLLRLARELGCRADVRPVSLREWADASGTGTLWEVFTVGTAAVITPVNEVLGENLSIATPTCGMGPVASVPREKLTAIQFGTCRDNLGWMHELRAR